MEHTKYTIQIPLTVTLIAGPNDNPYDIYEDALALVDHLIHDSNSVTFASPADFDVFNVVSKA